MWSGQPGLLAPDDDSAQADVGERTGDLGEDLDAGTRHRPDGRAVGRLDQQH
jgi:hypothetical protein